MDLSQVFDSSMCHEYTISMLMHSHSGFKVDVLNEAVDVRIIKKAL